MKLINFIAILAIGIGGCTSAATEQKQSDDKSETQIEKQESAKVEANAEEPKQAETDDSPTKAINDFAKAYQEKDLVGVKKRFSFNALQIITKDAIAKNGNPDEAIQDFMDKTEMPFKGVPETRNEKITGNTAIVEVKANEKWIPMPLVLEDGKWRISFEKDKPGP